jgi:hypothetical protein
MYIFFHLLGFQLQKFTYYSTVPFIFNIMVYGKSMHVENYNNSLQFCLAQILQCFDLVLLELKVQL